MLEQLATTAVFNDGGSNRLSRSRALFDAACGDGVNSDLATLVIDSLGKLGFGDVFLAAIQFSEELRRHKSQEVDFQNLKRFAEIEAKLRQYGYKPTASITIAKQFWSLHGGRSEESLTRRILGRIGTPRWERMVNVNYFVFCLNEGTVDEVARMFNHVVSTYVDFNYVQEQREIFECVVKRAAQDAPLDYITCKYADLKQLYLVKDSGVGHIDKGVEP